MKTTAKRFLALFLCLVMCLGMLPASAIAEEEILDDIVTEDVIPATSTSTVRSAQRTSSPS